MPSLLERRIPIQSDGGQGRPEHRQVPDGDQMLVGADGQPRTLGVEGEKMHGTPLRQRAQAIVRAGVPKCDPTVATSRGQQATVGAVSGRGDRTVMGFLPLWPKVEAGKAQQAQRAVRAADSNLLLTGGNGEAVQTAGDRDLMDWRAAGNRLEGDPP